MTTVAELAVGAPPRPRQNWVLNPAWDLGTIIAAPVIWIACFGLLVPFVGAELLITFFAVCNVAHHLPTFIRIYGDTDLLRRFRWNILLAPIIPFAFIFLGTLYLLLNNNPAGVITYLFIILTLWDPWHFLMQEYGFVRIYDRPNPAPRSLAAWMDYTLCAAWFVFIMLAALNWFPEKLYELYCNTGLPLLLWFNGPVYHALETAALGVALAASLAYLVYLGWCRARGYWISPAKVWFLLIAFATLYLAYVPNPAMGWLAPQWDFTLGFAAIGMVHVSQYLAIVWKYNRNLAGRKGTCRPGAFRNAFARGGPRVMVGYVLLCAAYGAVLVVAWRTAPGGADVIVALAAAVNFTSTLMHYYYDGFIWKIRHKENQQFLGLRKEREPAGQQAPSWWDSFRRQAALATAARHALYFGLPLVLLSAGVLLVQADPLRNPQARLPRARALLKQGRVEEGVREAEAVRAAMEAQCQVERHMIALRPTAAHCAFAADLVYLKGRIQSEYIDPHRRGGSESRAAERREEIREAIRLMEQALALGGRLGNRGFPGLTEEDARDRLAHWRREAGLEPETSAGALAPGSRLNDGVPANGTSPAR